MHLRSKYEVSHTAGEEGRVSFHLLSPPRPQFSSALLPAATHPHLLRSEAFKSAADDERRLLTAASACLRLAVEGERLLAVERSDNFRARFHTEPFTSCWELTLQVLHPESYFCFCLMRNTNGFVFLRMGLIPLAPAGTGTEKVEFSGVMPGFMHRCANKGFLNPVPLTCKDKSYWGCVLLSHWQDRENNKIWKISFFIPVT